MATITTKQTEDFIGKCMAIASDMVKLPTHHVWLDYDKEADVLYMSFRKPQRATKTIETDEDILIRKDGKEIVGLTIMNASSKQRIKIMAKESKEQSFALCIENKECEDLEKRKMYRVLPDDEAAK